MPITYDLYTIPDPQDEENKLYHVRVVPSKPQTPKELEQTIEKRCTLTTTDVHASLIALSDIMKEELLHGRRVHLPGIGYFYLTITANPADKKSMQKVRAPELEVKSIAFRPDKELMMDLKKEAKFEPTEYDTQSTKQTEISMMGILSDYFKDHSELDRSILQRLCGLTRSTALRWLKRLEEEGKLENFGNRHAPRYRAVPGNFGVTRDR